MGGGARNSRDVGSNGRYIIGRTRSGQPVYGGYAPVKVDYSTRPELTPEQIAAGGRYHAVRSSNAGIRHRRGPAGYTWRYTDAAYRASADGGFFEKLADNTVGRWVGGSAGDKLADLTGGHVVDKGIHEVSDAIPIVVPGLAAGIITGGMGLGAVVGEATGSSIAGAAAEGAAQSALTSTGSGADSDSILQNTLYGAAGGAINAGITDINPTNSGYVNSALRGSFSSGAGSAIRGNNSDQILYDAALGGLSSIAAYGAGDLYSSDAAARFAGAGTNLALRNIFESPDQEDAEDAWYQYYNQLIHDFQSQQNMTYADTSGGINWDEVANTPEGSQLLALFNIDESDPTKQTSKVGGAGQYGIGSDQIEQQDPSITGEYTV